MQHTNIKAILFDLDGTLCDSREAILSANERALAHYDIVIERAVLTREAHSIRTVYELANIKVPYDEFRDRYHATYKADHLAAIVLYEHVVDVLDALKNHGYKLAIVSSSRFAKESITAHGLDKFFDVIVGGADVKEHKPHPEPLFLATQQLEVRADEAVMVGDMVVDVEADKAAGVARTVAVTHGLGYRDDLIDANPDNVIDSLDELPRLLIG